VRRVIRAAGQLLFDFSGLKESEESKEPKSQEQVASPEPIVEQKIEVAPEPEKPQPAAPKSLSPPPAKQRTRQTYTFEGPTVVLHKHGRRLLVKPLDAVADMAWKDLQERLDVQLMRNVSYWTSGEPVQITGSKTVELWQVLATGLEQHPWVPILRSYGVYVHIHPCLKNWMQRELRRQQIESTAFPMPKIETNIPLFDRCAEGTVLYCIKDLNEFKKGSRYYVMSTGDEGRDVVVLSTEPLKDKATLSTIGKDKARQWTSFDPPMEEWFDDSEELDFGEDLPTKYPELVARMNDRVKALGLPLFEHVAIDVALGALHRSGINAYPMRMGKTSYGVVWALLKGSHSVGWIGPRNARIFTVKELNRLGFKEDQDFVVVDKLKDLEKPARFYLLTYPWLKRTEDPGYKARSKNEGLLRPSKVSVRREGNEVEIDFVNECPHCKKPMERYILQERLVSQEPEVYESGWEWTQNRGYVCRNSECMWVTDNKDKEGAAWKNNKKKIRHKGGYVDFELAAHANCPDKKISGRMCPTCKVVDSVWTPGLYKRLRKRFKTLVDDEIHNAKTWDNPRNTIVAQAVYNLSAKHRLGLTGTLISNSPLDSYWPLHWTANAPTLQFPYARQTGKKEFDTRFCDAITLEKPIGHEVDEVTGATTAITKTVRKRVPFLKNPRDFWRFMAPKVIRRTEDDPFYLKALAAAGVHKPKIKVQKYSCPMDPEQAKIMLASIKDFRAQFEKMAKEADKKGHEINSAIVISQMSSLRMVATCPEMLNDTFGTTVYKGVRGGGKMAHIKALVEDKIEDKKQKVIILSDFLAMQKTCEAELHQYNPILFNVGWDDEARKEAFDTFQQDDQHMLWIAGTRAIREGSDLSRADTCVCADLLWSPAFQSQAWSRMLTPNTRERECEIYLMVSQNSLDEHIYNVFYSKMVAAAQAMDRQVIARRAREFDVRWFVERVLEEESAIEHYLSESGDEYIAPELNIEEMAEREA
jgi:hypothetical protein